MKHMISIFKKTAGRSKYLFLLCGFSKLIFASGKMAMFIAIPITRLEHEAVVHKISSLQQNLKKLAAHHQYEFDIDLVPVNNLHITLEAACNIQKDDLDIYRNGARWIAQCTKTFDLSDSFRTAQLELMGSKKDWGVLRLSTDNESPIVILAKRLRNFFLAKQLKIGRFKDFRAHVSLGKFKKTNSLLKPKNLEWASSDHLEVNPSECTIRSIVFSSRQHCADQTTEKVKWQNNEESLYPLWHDKN